MTNTSPKVSPFHHMTLADIPPRIGLFPLGKTLLLPKGRLPLTIFEPRYIALLEDALAGRRMMGMIQPQGTSPPGVHHPPLEHTGTLGRITSFVEHDNGRFSIVLTGICRFHLLRDHVTPHGWREGLINASPFMEDMLDHTSVPFEREPFLSALKTYLSRHHLKLNWDIIESLADEPLLTTLPMSLPLTREQQQMLLEAYDLHERALILFNILTTDEKN